MGMEWHDLTEEELCDLMCGKPEEEIYECEEEDTEDVTVSKS